MLSLAARRAEDRELVAVQAELVAARAELVAARAESVAARAESVAVQVLVEVARHQPIVQPVNRSANCRIAFFRMSVPVPPVQRAGWGDSESLVASAEVA